MRLQSRSKASRVSPSIILACGFLLVCSKMADSLKIARFELNTGFTKRVVVLRHTFQP